MNPNLSLNTHNSFNTKQTLKESGITFPARVLDVIYQGPDSEIGSIIYKPLIKITDEAAQTTSKAYPLSGNITTIPLKNEIVIIQLAPSINIGKNSNSTRAYYTTVVNLWDSPHHNGYPDQSQNPGEIELGENFIEREDVNPLRPLPGDILIEGRQGQSLRFTGTYSSDNPWVDKKNNGLPLTILSNGQISADTGYEHIYENIDKDPSSLYLTSEHTLSITPANQIDKAFPKQTPPVDINRYRGAQAVVNADRIVLNSKKDDIVFTAKTSIGIGGTSVNLQGDEYIALAGKKIYLGEKSLNDPDLTKEPVLLGNQTESFLSDLLDMLQGAAVAMAGSGNPVLIERGKGMIPVIKRLRGRINPSGGPSQLKSVKVFVDPGKK